MADSSRRELLSESAREVYDSAEAFSSTLASGLRQKDHYVPLPSLQSAFVTSQTPKARPMTQSLASMVGSIRQYTTLCVPLDKILGGGLKRGHILEISGPPGSAKEMMARNIVRSFIEAHQQVLFIDIQNMTSPAVLDMALRQSASLPPDYMSQIHYMHLATISELLVFLRNLPSWLESHPGVGLFTLSSLSFLFQNSDELAGVTRHAMLEKVKEALTKASASLNLTVVITSQLSTKLLNPDGSAADFDTGSRAVMVPQLGGTYLPSGRTNRIIIVPRTPTTGVLRLLSSPTHVQGRGPAREESYELIGGVMR